MIANLQVLRAIAAFMVVYQHSYRLLTGHEARGWEWGGAGVDIFFVISGFIMVYTTQGGRRPIDFWRNRLERIVPLYWVVTLAVFGVALTLPGLLGSTRGDMVELLKSMFFWPYVKGSGTVEPMLMVGWSLNLEMFFYLVFGACLYLGKRSVWACAALLLALVAAHPFVEGPIAFFMTQPLMLGFIAGMLIAKYRATIPTWLAIAITPFCFLAFIIHVNYFPTVDHGIARLLPAALIVIAFVSIDEGIQPREKSLMGWGVLLGNASYAIYLVHPFVTQAVAVVAPKRGLLGVISFCVSMIGSGIAGVIVYKNVEKPITDYLKRKRRGHSSGQPRASVTVPDRATS